MAHTRVICSLVPFWILHHPFWILPSTPLSIQLPPCTFRRSDTTVSRPCIIAAQPLPLSSTISQTRSVARIMFLRVCVYLLTDYFFVLFNYVIFVFRLDACLFHILCFCSSVHFLSSNSERAVARHQQNKERFLGFPFPHTFARPFLLM